MRCKRSKKICQNWAKDFMQTGNTTEAGFWNGLSLAFHYGSEIKGDGLDYAIRQIKMRISENESVKSMMPAQYHKAVNEISAEANFLLNNLESMKR